MKYIFNINIKICLKNKNKSINKFIPEKVNINETVYYVYIFKYMLLNSIYFTFEIY